MNNKGMTLTEMLAATLIMLLVSLGMATGVALSNKQFTASIKQSEAQELYSTLSSLITNELRYTSQAKYEGVNVDCFFSVTYAIRSGYPSLVSLDEDGNVTSEYGQLALGKGDEFNRILGSASYTYNLGAYATITYNQSTKIFTVDLAIGTMGEKVSEDNSIINKKFSVRALNMGDTSLESCEKTNG